jgi:hypothetical protein
MGPESDVPSPRYYEVVMVSSPDYLAYEITQALSGGEFTVLLEPVRSLEVVGRILDSRTHAPIEGARVYFGEYPPADCTSDAAGHFRLRATAEIYRQHRARALTARPFGDELVATHPKYRARGFHCGEVGDIMLDPKESP